MKNPLPSNSDERGERVTGLETVGPIIYQKSKGRNLLWLVQLLLFRSCFHSIANLTFLNVSVIIAFLSCYTWYFHPVLRICHFCLLTWSRRFIILEGQHVHVHFMSCWFWFSLDVKSNEKTYFDPTCMLL